MKKILKKMKWKICLIFIFLFHLTYNLLWIQEKYVPLSDEAYYFLYSLKIYNNFPQNFLLIAFSIHPARLTLFPLTALPFYLLLGPSLSTTIIVEGFYLLILLISSYLLGKKLFGEEKWGFLLTLVISSFPGIFVFSRLFYVEFPLTALVTLSFYVLLLTNFFKNRKISILFGICLGLTALMRDTFLIFLGGPLVFIFFKILRRKKQLKNFFLAVFLSFLVASSLYLPKIFTLIKWNIAKFTDKGVWTIQQFNFLLPYYYLLRKISVFLSFFLLFSILFILKNFKQFFSEKNLILTLLVVIIPLLFFTFSPIKYLRYTLPSLPFIGVLIVYPLTKIKRFKKVIILLLILSGFLTFLLDVKFSLLFKARTYDTFLEIKETHINEILKEMKNGTILGIFNIHLVPTLEAYFELNKMNIQTILVYENNNPVLENVEKCDYLLIAPDWESGAYSKGKLEETSKVIELLNEKNSSLFNQFKIIKAIDTSSGSILLYKRV